MSPDGAKKLTRCWIETRNTRAPLQGYPSVGDLHSTVTVPKDKWFEYAGERSGRFQVSCLPVSCVMPGSGAALKRGGARFGA